MEARESGNMSYVWQSILAARPVLQEGSIWQVGDGPNINIVKDKKLPGSSTIMALLPPTRGRGEYVTFDSQRHGGGM